MRIPILKFINDTRGPKSIQNYYFEKRDNLRENLFCLGDYSLKRKNNLLGVKNLQKVKVCKFTNFYLDTKGLKSYIE